MKHGGLGASNSLRTIISQEKDDEVKLSMREAFMLLDKDLKVDLQLQINGLYGPISSKARASIMKPPLQSKNSLQMRSNREGYSNH